MSSPTVNARQEAIDRLAGLMTQFIEADQRYQTLLGTAKTLGVRVQQPGSKDSRHAYYDSENKWIMVRFNNDNQFMPTTSADEMLHIQSPRVETELKKLTPGGIEALAQKIARAKGIRVGSGQNAEAVLQQHMAFRVKHPIRAWLMTIESVQKSVISIGRWGKMITKGLGDADKLKIVAMANGSANSSRLGGDVVSTVEAGLDGEGTPSHGDDSTHVNGSAPYSSVQQPVSAGNLVRAPSQQGGAHAPVLVEEGTYEADFGDGSQLERFDKTGGQSAVVHAGPNTTAPQQVIYPDGTVHMVSSEELGNGQSEACIEGYDVDFGGLDGGLEGLETEENTGSHGNGHG